jgi:hypothetical protein
MGRRRFGLNCYIIEQWIMRSLRTLTHKVHLHPDYFNSEVDGAVLTEKSVSADKTTRHNNPEEDKVNTIRFEQLVLFKVFWGVIYN